MGSDTTKEARRGTGIAASQVSPVTRFRKPLVDYLISGLEDDDKWVRIFASDLLGTAGDPRAIDYLKPFLADRDQDLRLVSASALEKIHSGRTAASGQADRCSGCMIRHIAEEALLQQKPKG